MNPRWQYKVVKFETTGWLGGKIDETEMNQALDRLGIEGWELVSCFDTNQSHGASLFVVCVLKRQG
jgi:Domain of unknown function (DUF4177)